MPEKSRVTSSYSLFLNYPHKENTLLHEVSKSDKSQYFSDENIDNADKVARQMLQAFGGLEIKRFGGLEIKRFASFTPWRNFRFRPASDLKVGMEVPITKNEAVVSATITSITEEPYDGLVYALDVPEARNFAANRILVHDSSSFSV